MKRRWIMFVVSAIATLNLFMANPIHATPLIAATPASTDFIQQLETNIIPKLENLLTPEQQAQFQTAISEGSSLRKAFKALTLTPDQKTQIKSLLKSLPGMASFASLTPEQKKQLFLKKKEFFMPTPEEITDKITAGMKLKGTTLPPGVSDKITDKLKAKEKLMPTPESIMEKVNAGQKISETKTEALTNE